MVRHLFCGRSLWPSLKKKKFHKGQHWSDVRVEWSFQLSELSIHILGLCRIQCKIPDLQKHVGIFQSVPSSVWWLLALLAVKYPYPGPVGWFSWLMKLTWAWPHQALAADTAPYSSLWITAHQQLRSGSRARIRNMVRLWLSPWHLKSTTWKCGGKLAAKHQQLPINLCYSSEKWF